MPSTKDKILGQAQCYLDAYLALIHEQRERITDQVRQADREGRLFLWQRPAPGKWSAGEHLAHTVSLNRFARENVMLLWPWFELNARFRRKLPTQFEIDDVYERANAPNNVGWLWPPKYHAGRPIGLEALLKLVEREHVFAEQQARQTPIRLLARMQFWDPAFGRYHFIQWLRVMGYHDAHHYQAIRKLITPQTKSPI